MPIQLRFFLEYMCFPFWVSDSDGGEDTVDPASLPISAELKHDINKWDRIFQATLDQNYPPDSGFASKKANELLWKAFHEEGRSLYKRLKTELEDSFYEVTSRHYS